MLVAVYANHRNIIAEQSMLIRIFVINNINNFVTNVFNLFWCDWDIDDALLVLDFAGESMCCTCYIKHIIIVINII